jgi:DNA-binding SARP family transcriptional activator/tRNA A-37 threonylcarbamoyl transferase component Bud32
MAHLALHLLGPPRIELDGEPVHIGRRKAVALLAYLALTGSSHSRDALATLLWPEQDQSRARAYLRVALAELNSALGEGFLLADRETAALDPDADLWLDVDQFHELVAMCETHGHSPTEVCPDCLSALAEAVELYCDDFLSGFTLRDSPGFDEWQFFQTEGLRQELASILERLIEGHTAQGEFEAALPYARRWLALDPLHEPAHRQLMQLYAWSGQRAAALRQYAECEKVLQDELGLPPEAETTQLYEAIKERRDPAPPGDGKLRSGISQTEQLHERYQLEAEIGRGGTGIVYQARDTLLERDVAVKMLSATALDAEARARLLHEARAAANLNHSNIVSIYDAGETGGTPFVVMELVQGESLDRQRPRDLNEIVLIARQICSALEHAHAHGIVHRDLKPENVLLAPDRTAKLADFGLARSVASRLTSEGTIAGTVFYLAPELALGQEFDGRADLYALGAMLYELTTGRLPFSGDDAVAVITQHLHAPVVPPHAKNPDIPPALDALILRLLSKSPQDRPATATEVLAVLEQPDFLTTDSVYTGELSVLERVGRGRMVGRERELAKARALWHKTLSGQGQTLLVSGEPGIGKTRLVQELVTQVRVAGATALVGASYPEGGGPYAPFSQVLRTAFRDGAGNGLDLPAFVMADLVTLAPALRVRYPDIPTNPSLDPEAEQQRVYESVITFCTALSERAPLLLVLEDAQWAESDTLSLFRRLARRARRHRMMLVTTYRETETGSRQPLQQVRLDLNREGLATCLKLSQLDRGGAEQLLATLFDEEITPEFLDNVYHETEGNPFFVIEVCKALVESEDLYFADGRWNQRTTGELQIPPSVRDVVQSRVAKLPAEAQDALRVAAVIGREFGFDTLAEASRLDEEALIDALEASERGHLIEEVSGQEDVTFTFAHALIPGTLYESVSTLRRHRLHRDVAAAIETVHPGDESRLASLAHHYAEAGDQERARVYHLQAGDHARRSVAFGEAGGHYRAALERWPDGEEAARAETLWKLLECLYITGDFPEAVEAYEESSAFFDMAGDRVGRGAVERLMGRICFKLGKRAESLTHYHNALSILQDGPESVELARAVSAISRMHMVAAEYGEAVAMGERALALAERLGAEDVKVHARNNIGVSLVSSGDPDRGLAMLQDSLRRALALGLPYDTCRAYYNLGSGFEKRGRYSEARATYVDLAAYAERVGAALFVVAALVELNRVDWISGQWVAALARREQILELLAELPAPGRPGALASTVFGKMHTDLGQAEAARAELESGLASWRSAPELRGILCHTGLLVPVYAALGMDSEAAALAREMVSCADTLSYLPQDTLTPLLCVCQWSAGHGDDDAFDIACVLLGHLERAHEQGNSPVTDACLREGRGSVALAEGDHQEAVECFRNSVARWEEMGRPYDQARALSGLGRAQLGIDDAEAAAAAFDQALDIYDALASQLEDVDLKRSFMNSRVVRKAREARAALQLPDRH